MPSCHLTSNGWLGGGMQPSSYFNVHIQALCHKDVRLLRS